jgi:hypothetical protein
MFHLFLPAGAATHRPFRSRANVVNDRTCGPPTRAAHAATAIIVRSPAGLSFHRPRL